MHIQLVEESDIHSNPTHSFPSKASTFKESLLTLSDESEKRELMRMYNNFNISNNNQKIYQLISWLDSKKICNQLTFYHYVKEFYFSTAHTAIHLYQKSEILTLALSPDKKTLILGSINGCLSLWNLKIGEESNQLTGHSAQISSIVTHKNRIYSGSYDQTIKIWDYLSEIATLKGHTESILALAIDKEGTKLASGGEDRVIIIWDIIKFVKLKSLLGHNSAISALVYSTDSTKIYSGSWDLNIRVWELTKKSSIAILEGHKDLIRAIRVTPDGTTLISAGDDKLILLWDLSELKIIATLKGHTQAIRTLDLSSDGKLLVSGSDDKNVKIWDIKDRKSLQTLAGSTGNICSIVINSEELQILTCSGDKIIRVWEIKLKDHFNDVKIDIMAINVMIITSDGQKLITGSKDNSIVIWDVSKNQQIIELFQHNAAITSLEIHPNQKFFLSGSIDKTIIEWDLMTYQKKSSFIGHKDSITHIKYSHDVTSFISISLDNTLRIWDISKEKQSNILSNHIDSISALEVPKQNLNTIITGSKEGNIYVWYLKSLKLIKTLKGHTLEITALKACKDGLRLVSSSMDHTLILWDHALGIILETFHGHGSGVLFVTLNYKENIIFSGGKDDTVRLWDVNSGKQFRMMEIDKPFTCFSLTQDDSLIIFPTKTNVLKYQNINKLKVINSLKADFKNLRCFDLSKDEEILVSGGEDSVIKVWDFKKTTSIGVLKGHSNHILTIKISSDKTKIVSGSADNTIRIWSLLEMNMIGILKGTSYRVTCMGLFSKNKRLISGAYDNSLRIWDLEKYEKILVKYPHSLPINTLLINSGENRFFSAGRDNTILIGELLDLSEVVRLKGHSKPINCLFLTSDEMILLSGADDQTIKVWCLDNLQLLQTLIIDSEVYSLGVNYSQTKLFIGQKRKSVEIWDLKNYKKIGILDGSDHSVNCLLVHSHEKRIITGESDGKIQFWDINEEKKIPFLEGHCLRINKFAITPDGKKILTISRDKNAIVWDLKEGKQLLIFQKHTWFITALAITHDSRKAVTATYSLEIKVWDLMKGNVIKDISPEAQTECLILSPDNTKIITGCCDSYIRILDINDGSLLQCLEKHTGAVKTLCLSKDGEKIISGAVDNIIIIWDLKTYSPIISLTGHSDTIYSIIRSKDNNTFFSAGDDKSVIIWSFTTYQIQKVLNGHQEKIRDIVLNSDETQLIVACYPDEIDQEGSFIYIWDLKTFQIIKNLNCQYGCRAVGTTPNGLELIGASEKSLYIWEMKTWKIKTILRGYSNKIISETISDGKVFLGTGDNEIVVWDLRLSKKIAIIIGHTGVVNNCLNMSFSRIISASDDKSIRIWSLSDGEQKEILLGHSSAVKGLAMTKNEDKLVSCGNDKTIRIWCLIKNVQIIVLRGHNDDVISVRIINNSKIISGGYDKSIRLWDLENIKEIKEKCMLESSITNMIISPDEKLFIAMLGSSKMQVWEISEFEMLNEMELQMNNFHSCPVFLSNRLILYFNKIYDCYNDEIVFSFEVCKEMSSFFYDSESYTFYYLNNQFEILRFDDYWLNTYLYYFLSFDSLPMLEKNEGVICNRKQSAFPFLFSFMHLIIIFEKKEFFTKEKIQEVFGTKNVSLEHFYPVDIFMNTPLDILILKKNTNLIFKYFDLFFECFDNPTVTFHQKTRFLNYKFKENTNILDLIVSIISICEEDYSILSKLLEKAFMPLDPHLYDNNLNFEEMDRPLIVETDSFRAVNKGFIEGKLKTLQIKKKKIEKSSSVKCKIICIPNIIDICNLKTKKIFSHLTKANCLDDIFQNESLSILVEFIWASQIRFYFIVEAIVFVFFFFLFNLNFIYIYKFRVQDPNNKNLEYISMGLNAFIMIYSFICLSNELYQMLTTSFFDYFQFFWNYLDILLIPLMFFSSFLDISLIMFDYNDTQIAYFKLIFAISMFCFWFRFLSFFRAIKETSSTMRLMFNVVSGVRYFVMFMILLMLTLTSTFLILLSDLENNYSLIGTLYDFYKSTIGDSSVLEDYSTDFSIVNSVFLVISTFVFAIILLNLLVAILSDKHNEINQAEEKTRLFELINLIADTDTSLITRIVRLIKKPEIKGKYLVYLYNEKHEKKMINSYEELEKKMEDLFRNSEKAVSILVEEKIEKLKEYIKEIKETKFKKFESASYTRYYN